MKTPATPCRIVNPGTGPARFGPADRARLACYLGVPSATEFDELTRAEADRLDAERDSLVDFWQRAVALPIDGIDGAWIELEGGVRIEADPTYARQLARHGADWLVVATFTLGAGIDARVRGALGRDDLFEAFVLKQWASVMTEQARAWLTHALCGWADHQDRTLLPYHGPGYHGWPLTGSIRLIELLREAGVGRPAPRVCAAESGMLTPLHSMVIVYGATPHRAALTGAESLAQCRRCALRNCRYRVANLDPSAPPEIRGVAEPTPVP